MYMSKFIVHFHNIELGVHYYRFPRTKMRSECVSICTSQNITATFF